MKRKGDIIDYEEWLEKEWWLLDEAVSIIRGDKPLPPSLIEGAGINKYDVFNFRSRTYQKSLQAIKSGDLEARDFEEIEFNCYSLDMKYWCESWIVRPRTFIKWALANNFVVHNELIRLCSYEYWTSKEFWHFNEAVILLQSQESPLPRDVFNVLEKEATFDFAVKVRDAISRGLINYRTETFEFDTVPWMTSVESRSIIEWAIKEGIPFPDELKKSIQHVNNIEWMRARVLGDIQTISEQEYIKLINMPSWTIQEAINIVIGVKAGTPIKTVSKLGLYQRHIDVSLLISKSWEAGKFQVIGTNHDIENYKGHVEPRIFIHWAKMYGVIIPETLLTIIETDFCKKSSVECDYTTPYIELMKQAIIENKITVENQCNVESLKQWFLDRGMSDRLAKAMATLIRMPASQAGAGKKRNNG